MLLDGVLEINAVGTYNICDHIAVLKELEGGDTGDRVLGLKLWDLGDVYLDERGIWVLLGHGFEPGGEVHAWSTPCGEEISHNEVWRANDGLELID